MKMLSELSANQLIWFPELGIGYYPVVSTPYDASYFDKYVEMENTKIGLELNEARLNLVRTTLKKERLENDVIDIGIGSGAFVKELDNCKGYDINPKAVDWLKNRYLYRSPYVDKFSNATFWDSLEHIHKPKALLDNVENFVFISCPIYEDGEHILRSKHFRKDEHCWYWTHGGLITFMATFGFRYISSNKMESDIGREDISTFVFKRMK